MTLPAHYYSDDAVTIYHGDCRDILPSLNGIDCIVTSPPYNQMAEVVGAKPSGLWADSHGGAGFMRKMSEGFYADDMEESAYQEMQNEIFGGLEAACNESASLFYNHQLRWRDGTLLHPVQWFRPRGWRLRQEIVWDRAGGMMFNARLFCRFDERILWFVKGRHKWAEGASRYGSIWRLAREQQQQGKQHPVEFPIEIPLRSINAATEPGDLVLDPFMGSGTTLRAAKDLGRKAIGIEIEERYCAIAAKRMAQATLQLDGVKQVEQGKGPAQFAMLGDVATTTDSNEIR